MGIFDEPKVDCHVHVFDPPAFPYGPDTFYAPSGQEIGRPDQLLAVMDAYGVRQALVVGPNSGYDGDNRCLLDLLAREPGRLRGMAVVPATVSRSELADLAAAGVIGVTMNVAQFGPAFYDDAHTLVRRLGEQDLLLDLQVSGDQLLRVAPLLAAGGVRIVVDHCGRPDPAIGLDQKGFRALLDLAGRGGVSVKLSGLMKCSREPYPYRDAWPYVHALLDAFGPEACVWGSDWPFLRAPDRVDYGPLLTLVQHLIPDADTRRAVLWQTPARLLGITASTGAPEDERPQAGREPTAESDRDLPAIRTIRTDRAPAHTGPVPQAVTAGGGIPVSALFGADAETHLIPADPQAEAELLLDNLAAVLAAAGARLSDVVRAGIVMRDLERDRPVFNQVWAQRFDRHRPARSAVQSPRFGRTGENARFMLEVTAFRA